jgi:hypothetical protein
VRPFDALNHAVRTKEILAALARHGFADLPSQIDLPKGFWQKWLPAASPQHGGTGPPGRRRAGANLREAWPMVVDAAPLCRTM